MFITLEGIEGAGKTTQLSHIVDFLKALGHDCVVTREPGGTEIGQKIRSILLDPENRGIVPLAELMLYAADRAQHLEGKIRPSLEAGKTVICDRFFDATTAYQGYARGLDLDLITSLHEIVLMGIRPDITLLFDLPAEVGLARARKALFTGARNSSESRFEEEELAFHRRVRNGYLKLAKKEPRRFKVLDASGNEARVMGIIQETLKGYVNEL